MISIKKYLDLDKQELAPAGPESNDLLAAAMECYRGVLSAVGKCAVQISPGHGAEVETNMGGLVRRLSVENSAEAVRRTKGQVEIQLQEWSARTAEHFKAQATEVKDLLIALARAAEAVGSRDDGYTSQFKTVTGSLEKLADLNDLTEIRSSLVKSVSELRNSVEQMTRENRQLVSQLREEISTYEARLKSVEHLALKDELTGLANRRSVEERIHWSIANAQEFCIVMLDLNHFKQVNDQHGHLAGDDLLRQFGTELHSNTRTGDLVGRWGGDEFVVVLTCDSQAAGAHITRIQEWVFGKYTIRGASKATVVVEVDASIGVAGWHAGDTTEQLIAEADAAMYRDKNLSRQKVQ